MYESPRSQTKSDEPRAQRDLSTARIVERIVGRQLASEVEEYFERGARVLPGDVVVDVGANIGAFAAAVAARTGGDVTLHCFEPRGPIFTSLERNFAEHALLRETRHELHAVALSSPLQHGTARPFLRSVWFEHEFATTPLPVLAAFVVAVDSCFLGSKK